LVSPEVACQASDRLVVTDERGTFAPFDRRANKTLVLVATDAVAFISYAGEAYIGDVPTDEWIARVITGNRYVSASPLVGGATWAGTLITTGTLPLRDIGQTALILARELERARTGLRAEDRNRRGPWIVIAALQWKAKRPMYLWPFLATIEPRQSDARYAASFPPAREERPPFFVIYEAPLPTDFARGELDVSSMVRGWRHPEVIEDDLVAAIRIAADRHPTRIGKDCVTVSTRADCFGPIRVRFHPGEAHSFNLPGVDEAIPVAYTPWLIGPKMAAPPQQAFGGAYTDVLGSRRVGAEETVFRAEVDAPEAPGSRWGTRTAYRKPPPNR
jgi:hypothetical protein